MLNLHGARSSVSRPFCRRQHKDNVLTAEAASLDAAHEAADSRRGCGSPWQVLSALSKSQAECRAWPCSPAAKQLKPLSVQEGQRS